MHSVANVDSSTRKAFTTTAQKKRPKKVFITEAKN